MRWLSRHGYHIVVSFDLSEETTRAAPEDVQTWGTYSGSRELFVTVIVARGAEPCMGLVKMLHRQSRRFDTKRRNTYDTQQRPGSHLGYSHVG